MKDAYYFSHDSNAKDDPKCMLLIDQLGLEGYGIFWVLIETLRDQPDYKYPLKLVPILAKRFNTSAEKMLLVVQKYDLFQFNGQDFFYSNSLNNRMIRLDNIRELRKIAGIASGKARKQKALNKCSTDVQLMPNKTEQSKAKDSIVEDSKEVNIYHTQQLFYKSEHEKATEHKKDYSKFINALFVKNDLNRELGNVLRLKDQLTYTQFVKILYLSRECKKEIIEVMLSMENKPKAIKDNTSLYMTLRNWIKFRK